MSGSINRRLILRLADSKSAERWISQFGPRLGAYRFVAGNTPEDACEAVRRLAKDRLSVTLDHLGESVRDEAAAWAAAEAYLKVLDALEAAQLTANVSIKLTQMGLDLSPDLCRQVVRPILEKVSRAESFCRIDMEDSAHTDLTLELYEEFRRQFSCVGIVLQAYLYRTPEDLARVSAPGANVRIVKGAYLEPSDQAFPRKADVDAHYVELVKNSLSRGNLTAIATHDEAILRKLVAYVQEQGIPKNQYEFQMLYGIRSARQRELASQGQPVRVYVPYGPDWYAYFMRRLAERPANVWFFLRNLTRS